MNNLLLPIGNIAKSHGIEGEFIVDLFSKEIDLKNNIRKVWLGKSLSHTHSWFIINYRISTNSLYLTLRKIDTKEEANYLKGLTVYFPKNNITCNNIFLLTEFDIFSNKDDTNLGSIIDIDNRGEQPLFIVQDKDDEFVLPAVKDLIVDINWKNRTVYYKSINGLI